MQLVVEFLWKRNQTELLDTVNVFRITENFNTCSDGAESEVLLSGTWTCVRKYPEYR
jgi:hypothetical protein